MCSVGKYFALSDLFFDFSGACVINLQIKAKIIFNINSIMESRTYMGHNIYKKTEFDKKYLGE